MLTFKTLRYKNILSVGNHFSEISLNGCRKTLISAKNGSGKCISKESKISIDFADELTKKKFTEFMKSR